MDAEALLPIPATVATGLLVSAYVSPGSGSIPVNIVHQDVILAASVGNLVDVHVGNSSLDVHVTNDPLPISLVGDAMPVSVTNTVSVNVVESVQVETKNLLYDPFSSVWTGALGKIADKVVYLANGAEQIASSSSAVALTAAGGLSNLLDPGTVYYSATALPVDTSGPSPKGAVVTHNL